MFQYAGQLGLGHSATKANITIPDLYHLTKAAKQDEKLAQILHKLRDHINVTVSFYEKPACDCEK